jgi:hypothetical protein
MVIRRFFSQENLVRAKTELNYIIDTIMNSYGELDLSIREDYFNLYYRGNSLAKIVFKAKGLYQISIHNKFFYGTRANNRKYFINLIPKKDYTSLVLNKDLIHPFFQKKHIDEFCSRIKEVNWGEEADFEQSLISDNLNREDIIFIDRQITDSKLRRMRMDLLALVQDKEDKYSFLVAEVKLGNNSELNNKVAGQLTTYVNHIKNHFSDYINCYQKQYEQKKELGLFLKPRYQIIKIQQKIEGVIIVGGYSGKARQQIETLRLNFPNLQIMTFFHPYDRNKLK